MKLTFYGAARAVTGSCHCIDACGKRILVDCGLQQGRDEIDENKLPFHPGEVDYVFATHAHLYRPDVRYFVSIVYITKRPLDCERALFGKIHSLYH